MSCPRIDEIDGPPVIGQRYYVPTVFGVYIGGRPRNWPVMGTRHEDGAVLGFHEWHYHIDPRFIAQRTYARLHNAYRQSAEVTLAAAPLMEGSRSPNPSGLPKPVWRLRLCQRDRRDRRWMLAYGSFFRLQDALAAARLRPGLVCPHKGYCLKGEPVVDGEVTCPLHGLVWSVETGRLVRQAGYGLPSLQSVAASDRRESGG